MSIEKKFTKDEIDHYLYLLAKEYKKRNRKAKHVELILVGGASIIINYGFRDMTTDIDAVILADSIMKEAILRVAEDEELPYDWLNADFKRSPSFSGKLVQHSEYYQTFANVLEIRTVAAEYLVAMKLVSGRNYKRDLSDIAGILIACEQNGKQLRYEDVDRAVRDLYGGWEKVDSYAAAIFEQLIRSDNKSQIYESIRMEEDHNKALKVSDLIRNS